MKTFFTVLVTVAAVLLAERAYQAYRWKQFTDTRSYYAGVSASYLFASSGVKAKDGTPLSRQALLDAMLHSFAEQNGLQFAH